MNALQRASTAYIIPEWKFERLQSVSRSAHEVYWICETCGPIEPIVCANGFIRCQCACERAQWEMLKNIHGEQPISTRCYSWLGRHVIDDLADKTFDNFYPDHQPDRMAFVGHRASCKIYAGQIVLKQPVDNLLLVGGFGTGKTHLAAAILNHLRVHHVGCLFCTVQDLFDEFYLSSFEGQSTIITQASSTSLLVLDDLDKLYVRKETDGEFQKKRLFTILDKRYKRGLPTIITTNEQTTLTPWLDGATISRLSEHLTGLEMNGVDYRARGK